MNEIKKLQSIDTLSLAENITGKSYKENDDTGLLGMALQMEKSKELNKLLDKSDDTKFSNTVTDYLRKLTDFGFDVVLKDPFINSDNITEHFYILWHSEYSILLSFDTYTFGDDGSFAKAGREVPEPSVNGGKFYYSWIPNSIEALRMGLTSSGVCTTHVKPDFSGILEYPEPRPKWNNQEWDDFKTVIEAYDKRNDDFVSENDLKYVWQGDHDCREAVKNNISLLAENGTFLKKWLKLPFLWLVNYMETKKEGYDYEAISKSRLERLPVEVQKAIGYESLTRP